MIINFKIGQLFKFSLGHFSLVKNILGYKNVIILLVMPLLYNLYTTRKLPDATAGIAFSLSIPDQ